MNKYFHIIFLCAAILVSQTATAGRFSTDYLKAGQVKKLFSGKTVSGDDLKKGSTFKRYYDPDGTLLSDAQGYRSTGHWRIDANGAHCVTWDDRGKEHCLHIKANGDGTYTKIRPKSFRKIPVVVYRKFNDGNVFAQAGEPVNLQDFKKKSPAGSQAKGELLQAVTTQDLEKLDKAVADGANVNATFEQFKTALFFAVEKRNADIINRLISAGADVNAQDAKGNTPLIVATKNDSIGTVQLLLQNGADAKIKNKAGKDALTIAQNKKLIEVASVLTENNDGATALGLFIDIKSKHITEAQFRQAAVKAFKARNWHVDKEESNVVAGTYKRNDDRVFKSRMIYQPDLLLIRFDSAMGYPKANYLTALRTLFFNYLEN